MIRIRQIELREIRLRLKEPFRISSGSSHVRRVFLVQVRDADGSRGWAECVAGAMPNYSPETIDTAWWAIKTWIAPRVLEAGFEDPAQIFPVLEENIRGHKMAKAAIEMAAWELVARRREVSLASLLGGDRKQIPVGISMGIQPDPQSLARKVVAAFQQGYRKFKAKIAPGHDLDFLEAACEAAGGGSRIMADANNAYTLEDLEVFRAMDGFGLMMIEQPLDWDDVRQHAQLQRQIETPICLDESITSLERARDMVELGGGRIVNIKPGRLGGFAPSMAVHDYCRDQGIPVWCGGMLESGVGRAHNVALASLANFSLPGDLSPSSRYWEKDIVIPEWEMDSEGFVAVPWDRPGMGVELDLDRVENLTAKREVLE